MVEMLNAQCLEGQNRKLCGFWWCDGGDICSFEEALQQSNVEGRRGGVILQECGHVPRSLVSEHEKGRNLGSILGKLEKNTWVRCGADMAVYIFLWVSFCMAVWSTEVKHGVLLLSSSNRFRTEPTSYIQLHSIIHRGWLFLVIFQSIYRWHAVYFNL